jgi:hypothetical protein
MCIRVDAVPRALLDEPWDPQRQLITIPSELRDEYELRAVRVVLIEVGVPQPDFGAVCWCGEQIQLPGHTPEQQRSERVINGA